MPEKKKDPLDALPKGTFDMEVTYTAIFELEQPSFL